MPEDTDIKGQGVDDSLTTDPLLSDKHVEALTGIATGTLRWWRHKGAGDGPKWFRLGPKAIRYRRSDVDAWIEEHYARAGS